MNRMKPSLPVMRMARVSVERAIRISCILYISWLFSFRWLMGSADTFLNRCWPYRYKRSTLLFVLLQGSWLMLQAQASLKFEHIGVQQGFFSLATWNILQDTRGYMWFATNDGLHKYDGYGFTNYEFTPHDTTSVAHHTISALWEDPEGDFWMGTIEGGICKFDRSTEKFTTFKPPQPKGLQVPALRAVSAIGEDKEGMLWAGNWLGELRRFDKHTGTFSQTPFDMGYRTKPGSHLTIDGIYAIYRDRKGDTWIGNRTGLHQLRLTPQGDGKASSVSFIHYYPDAGNPATLSDSVVRTIYEDRKGMLWIGTDKGLNRYDPATGLFTRYLHQPNDPNSLSSNGIFHNSITEDLQGNLWIGTGNGLNKLNPERTGFTRYFHDPANPHSLDSDFITSVKVDRAGNLWVGTFGAEINKVNLYQQPFELQQQHPYNSRSLSHNFIEAIVEDHTGILWICTQGGGVNAYDKKTGLFTRYRHNPSDPASLASDRVKSIIEDSEGTLWIGNGDKISRFDRATSRFINSSGSIELDNSLQKLGAVLLYKDQHGLIWVGTMSGGIRSFNPETGTVNYYRHDPYDPESLTDHQTYCFLEDNKGDLWIGHGSVGTSRLNKQTGKFTRYSHNPLDTTSISANRVFSIYQDAKGRLWLGTAGGGLCQFQYDTGRFTTYTTRHGLSNNTVHSILEDDAGNLWLGTNTGLSRFSPETKTFTNYEAGDGLQNGQSTGACFKGKDGTLYVGGMNGLNIFHPRQLQSNKYVPPVVITQFKLFDKVLPGKHEAKQIQLNYDQNFFTLEFAALNYTNSRKNQYLYQLEGVDKTWVKAGSNRMAVYTDIDPGTYTFRVKGSNNDGIWNEQGRSLRIIIHPPWWRTIWAYMSYTLLFISALVLARKAIVNRERLQANLRVQRVEAEKLRELDSLKSRFFANISHEFRTPLAVINGLVQKWSHRENISVEQKADFGMIGRNASRLLQLINQLLDLSRLEAGKLTLHLQAENITAQLRAVAASFESLAQSKAITYRYTVPLQPVWALTDRDKVEKIVSNLLSNAIKFTPSGGQVIFSVSLDELNGKGELRLLVQDTGIGIAEQHLPHIFDRFYQGDPSATREHEGTGIGLALAKELTELLAGTIQVESQPGQGSLFRISLPLELTETPQALTSPEELIQVSENTIDPSLSSQLQTQGKQQPQVLLVEDNADLRTFIRESLSAEFTILEATDGQSGLEKAIETIPDLILSDVMMPAMDGFSLCEKLKTDERTSHIPVVLLTAKADMISKLTGLTNKADDYLFKPFEVKELQVRIQNLITQRQQLKQHYSRQFFLQPKDENLASAEDKFLQKALSIVEANLANTGFDVEIFSREIGMSSSQLRRKLGALTGQAPADYIRLIRLQKAANLLQRGQGNVSEVALMTGFNSLNYFTRCFKEHFGKTPSDFLRESHPIKVGS
ncbi:response regulator [Rhodocytophaga rosea]|uniref:histidine kinase n=1 Tax=Rhodocytophaga rosea TaxID=2704465 RepID=A0A6C0GU67_9BACT|nr:hybrid sensor histidine kinase/response regulator transcription factor [Rhodocytophaga rosea]QHT70892.1 response regulator [Rhodocytophaga rosea]